MESNGILKITGIDVSSQGYQESWLVEIPEGLVLLVVLFMPSLEIAMHVLSAHCAQNPEKCKDFHQGLPVVPQYLPHFLSGFPNPQSNFVSCCLPKDNEEKTDNWFLIFLRQQMREVYRCQREQVEMDFILGIKAFDLDKMLG